MGLPTTRLPYPTQHGHFNQQRFAPARRFPLDCTRRARKIGPDTLRSPSALRFRTSPQNQKAAYSRKAGTHGLLVISLGAVDDDPPYFAGCVVGFLLRISTSVTAGGSPS